MGSAVSPLLTYVLRLADDNLIVSQRLGELIASMPDLEDDIAVANIGLDHLGQARNFYQYATELDPDGRSEDQFAMLRSEREFLNAVLVEQPNGDFAQTQMRQFLLDAYQVPLYQLMTASTDERLAAIAAKAIKEARYHLERSSAWLVTLGNGTAESYDRLSRAVDVLWPYAGDLFHADEVEAELADSGVAVDPGSVRPGFDATVTQVFARANLTVPDDPYVRAGGRTGFHTEHLGHLLPEMQSLYRAHPGAQW